MNSAPTQLVYYRAISSQGDVRRGLEYVSSLAALQHQLTRQGWELLSYQGVPHWLSLRLPTQRLPGWLRVSRWQLRLSQRTDWLRQLAHLLQAGIPLDEALHQLSRHHPTPAARNVSQHVLQRLQHGHTLSATLASTPLHFSALTCGLVTAGEASGQLATALAQAAQLLEQDIQQSRQLQRLLAYPLFTLSVLLLTSYAALRWLVPDLLRLLTSTRQALPWSTQLLLDLATTLNQSGSTIVMTVVGVVIAIATFPLWPPVWQRAVYRLRWMIPLIGPLERQFWLARWWHMLATLQISGLPLLPALALCQQALPHRLVQDTLNDLHQQMQHGQTFAQACLRHTWLPPLHIHTLRCGELSGEFARMLHHCAEISTQAANQGLHTLQRAMEPLLTLLLGGLVAWLMSAILQPIYQLAAHLGG